MIAPSSVSKAWPVSDARAVDFTGPRWDLVRAAGTAWAVRVGPRCTGPEEVLLEDLDRPNQHLHCAW